MRILPEKLSKCKPSLEIRNAVNRFTYLCHIYGSFFLITYAGKYVFVSCRN